MRSGISRFFGERAVKLVAGVGGFLRANLPVWIGMLLALFAFYCAMDQQGV